MDMIVVDERNLQPWRLERLFWVRQLLLGNGVWVAGGALRTLFNPCEVISDFDLFFQDSKALDFTQDILEMSGYKLIFECPKGELFTYRYRDVKIQCIAKRFYSDAIDLIDSFDFTICQAAFDGTTLHITKSMIKSAKKKNLYLHKVTYPVATLNRMMKYKEKGYYVLEKTLRDIALQISAGTFDGEQLALYID